MTLRKWCLRAALLLALAVPLLPMSAGAQTAVGPRFLDATKYAGFPSTIAGSGSWSSGVQSMQGYRGISASATSTQAGAISIQRYLDAAGLIPIGTPITQAISANTLATVSVNDGLPAGYFQVTITNTSGSTATVTTPAIVMTGL